MESPTRSAASGAVALAGGLTRALSSSPSGSLGGGRKLKQLRVPEGEDDWSDEDEDDAGMSHGTPIPEAK